MGIWSKRLKSIKLEMRSREAKYPLQKCSDPMYSTVRPWWKMRPIKAEIKMMPDKILGRFNGIIKWLVKNQITEIT